MNPLLILSVIGVVLGLGLVWRASDYVVAHTLRLARHYSVSTFFVGFVVLALAANVPDLAITLVAAFQGVGQLAAGDIIGACFSDVALITGGTLVIVRSVPMSRKELNGFLRLILAAAVVMVGVFCLGSLNRLHGAVLLSIYAAFLAWAWCNRHEHVMLEVTADDLAHHSVLPPRGLFMVWVKTIASLAGVLIGSGVAIQCGVQLAQAYGFSLETVGATIIALGTSLPEVSMGFHAYRRGEYTLALGPTIGTVFSQSTMVLGLLALCSRELINLTTLQGPAIFMFVAFMIIAASILLKRVGRATGLVLVGLFVLYLLYHIFWI
jgi:cation:H+ antiporter